MKEPTRAKIMHPTYRIWMGIFLPLVFIRVKRKGKENFKKGDNYVVVLNHSSLADIPVSAPWVPGLSKTLAKIEITKVPLFGIMYRAGSILVDRSSGESRRKSTREMQETLKMGLHLTLFPEGTRNQGDKPLQAFHDGAFTMAISCQKDIIPGVIFNTRKIHPAKPSLWAWPHTIRIEFLKPIPVEGYDLKRKAELKEKVFQIMEHYIIENQ
jgi:1-acyl-sn-glycerol-3-phosphate acyltransferase